MKGPSSHLDVVGELFEALARLGLEPVLVGGMALVVLGSRRVTRDFDLLVARPGDGFGRSSTSSTTRASSSPPG